MEICSITLKLKRSKTKMKRAGALTSPALFVGYFILTNSNLEVKFNYPQLWITINVHMKN